MLHTCITAQKTKVINLRISLMGIKALGFLVLAVFCVHEAYSADFTVKNNCEFQIWPALLTGVGSPILTGFELAPKASRTVSVSAPWSGRLWARTGCSDSNGRFTCRTGDCGSGKVECKGAGGIPPATLTEFTLAGDQGKDFYDVSLVDGFNLPVSVSPVGRDCKTTSCPAKINQQCPDELAVREANGAKIGCKSACVAFGDPQYCCTGEYNNPDRCKPTNYSKIFKNLCPQAYSYAYDDRTSTFVCPTGGNFVITFCP